MIPPAGQVVPLEAPMQKPRPFWLGMNCFRDILRGSHLLAHTRARKRQIWAFRRLRRNQPGSGCCPSFRFAMCWSSAIPPKGVISVVRYILPRDVSNKSTPIAEFALEQDAPAGKSLTRTT